MTLILAVLAGPQFSVATAQERFDLEIPAAPVSDAIKTLSYQTGHSVLFQTDDVEAIDTNTVSGRYTLREALDALLEATPLEGGLTGDGIITISLARNGNKNDLEGVMTSGKIKTSLLTGVATALFGAGGALAQDAASEQADNARSKRADEITVTATRREESILDAPLSVTAYSQESLDIKGVRNIDDLARMTPGVSVNQVAFGSKYLVIRGLTSVVGATMNGVYIDDIPVQVRSVSLATNFYPAMFDLERVEVLRGPQGTLFGAGAMGGAIRFISAKPSVDEYSGYARGEVGLTEGGDPSYEAGAAIGGPIVKDKIGFRVSGYYRRDGGYIDRDPIVPSRGTARENHNSGETYVGQAALTFKPIEEVTITPSIFYQEKNTDNSDFFWQWRPANPYNRDPLPEFYSGEGLDGYRDDKAVIYSLNAEADLGPVSLISSTSYLDRNVLYKDDLTAFFFDALGGLGPLLGFPGPIPQDIDLPGIDERAVLNLELGQEAFTQEFRIQSNPGDSRLSYVIGLFFQDSRQRGEEFDTAPEETGPFIFGPDGLLLFGAPLAPVVNGNIGYIRDYQRDKQLAAFINLDYQLTDKLSVSAGVRYSRLTFDYEQVAGNMLPTDNVITGSTSEDPITPKFGIQYDATDDLMFYASAGKGFRPGGTNSIPAPGSLDADCQAQLVALGYLDGFPPSSYTSDSTWAYEVGAKGRVGDWLTFAGDVFRIDWTDVQRTRNVLNCGNPFLDNLGEARAQGVEGQVVLTPVAGFILDGNFSYTDATQQETLLVPGSSSDTIVTEGDRFAPPWIISVSATYEANLTSDAVGYARMQWDHRSGWDRPSGNTGFNPLLAREPTRDFVSTRVGVRTGGADISLFVDNLLNSRDEIGRLPLGGGERLLLQTYRPRTVGVTASYRF